MNIAFLTEMGFAGKVPIDNPNMRTEFAWMYLSNANHHNIYDYANVSGYDAVFVIIPKGNLHVSAIGLELSGGQDPNLEMLLSSPFIATLKSKNDKVYVVQEGPATLFNDWSINDQSDWYGNVASSSGILCHNECDRAFFSGLFQGIPVKTIRTMMIDKLVKDIVPTQEDKTIIGGNFSKWYGGFQSYIVARQFENQIYVPTSHSKRTGEERLEQLTHIPRVSWDEWMKILSSFRYAVHLMPTVAAGTFSMNCAYFGIPCIGNIDVDTQRICFPDLSVKVDDIESANELAIRLKEDKAFYAYCSDYSKEQVKKFVSSGNDPKWVEEFLI